MMPNRANHLWFKADKPGYYYGQCAEYCGESHAVMRFRVIALSPADYVKWLDNQKASARTADGAKSLAAEADVPHFKFASLKDVGPHSTLSGSLEFDANPFAAWQKMQDPGRRGGRRAHRRRPQALLGKDLHHLSHRPRPRGHRHHRPRADARRRPLDHRRRRPPRALRPNRLHQWIKDPVYFKPGTKMYNGGYIDVATGERTSSALDGRAKSTRSSPTCAA